MWTPNLIIKDMDLVSERSRLLDELTTAAKKRAAEIKKRLAAIEKERKKILAVVE